MSSGGRRGSARGWVLLGLGVMVCTRASIGQEPVNLETIRRTDFRSTIDRQRVQAWVKQQLDELFSTETPLPAAGAFYLRMLVHFSASDATTGFRDGLAELVAEEFTSRYEAEAANPAKTHPIPCAVTLTVLRVYGSPAALPCFKRAIKDPAPGVRLAAAEGLLAGKIEAQAWETLLSELQKAAMEESDPLTLSRLYRVLTKNGGPPVDQVVTALLETLGARFVRFEQKGESPAMADAEAATWLAGKFSGINNARSRHDIIRGIARLLADAVHAYLEPDATTTGKRQLERVIAITEKQLKAIAKAPGNRTQPNVTEVMFKGGEDRNEHMATACEEWIGTEAKAGFLNEQPFNFERGLSIKRAAPTTRPAPSPSGE